MNLFTVTNCTGSVRKPWGARRRVREEFFRINSYRRSSREEVPVQARRHQE